MGSLSLVEEGRSPVSKPRGRQPSGDGVPRYHLACAASRRCRSLLAVTGHPSGSSGFDGRWRPPRPAEFFRRLAADDGSDACAAIVRRLRETAPIGLRPPDPDAVGWRHDRDRLQRHVAPPGPGPADAATPRAGVSAPCLVGVPRALPRHPRAQVRGADARAARHPVGPAVADVAARDGAAHGPRRAVAGSAGSSRAGTTSSASSRTRTAGSSSASPPRSWSTSRSPCCATRSPTPARCWSAPSSTRSSTSTATQAEVRDIVVHMIEEYARHCGHADLLRECLDGTDRAVEPAGPDSRAGRTGQ